MGVWVDYIERRVTEMESGLVYQRKLMSVWIERLGVIEKENRFVY